MALNDDAAAGPGPSHFEQQKTRLLLSMWMKSERRIVMEKSETEERLRHGD